MDMNTIDFIDQVKFKMIILHKGSFYLPFASYDFVWFLCCHLVTNTKKIPDLLIDMYNKIFFRNDNCKRYV